MNTITSNKCNNKESHSQIAAPLLENLQVLLILSEHQDFLLSNLLLVYDF